MKLLRHGTAGKEKPGILINDEAYDLSGFGEDFNESFFENDGLNRLKKYLENNSGKLPKAPSGSRLGSPIARPSKIVCIGLNFADHARESKAKIPTEPILFMKSTSSLVGPNDNIMIPKNSQNTDWEVELGDVIGKKAS